MIKKVLDFVFNGELDLREQLFRGVVITGGVLGIMGIVECMILMDFRQVLLLMLIMFLTILGTSVIVFRYHKIEVAAIALGMVLSLVVFPGMFLLSGGIEGGATVWFVFALFYMFMMFSGKKLVFFVILVLLADGFVYLLGYFHPEMIVPMDSRTVFFIDSFFAISTVGVTGGSLIKSYIAMYDRARKQSESQKAEMEEMGKYKDTFFANVSHEIRTPINSIIGLNEMILRENPSEEIAEYVRSAQVASEMLLSLVSDLLDVSQIEMKKMKILPVEYKLKELLGNLIDVVSVLAREKGLDFLIDVDEELPSVLYGDEKRIRQVLLNILANAVKYTDSGSVTMVVRGEAVTGTRIKLKVVVEDTGIGIRKEDLEHLYEVFHRIDETAHSKTQGSGLGLSISKQLIGLMGGEITVDSIYTKGSSFTVQLEQQVIDGEKVGDIRFWKARQQKSAYHRRFEAPEARILIVDDNSINRMVTAKLLSDTKMQIDTAESGAQCLEMTKNKFYHVILMDYMMPDMDGARTLAEVHRQENGMCRDSAVLLMTAHSLAEAQKISEQNDFDGYIERPIHGEALETEILKFLPEDVLEYCERENGTSFNEDKVRRIWQKNKKRVLVTVDCACEIPEEWKEEYDIRLMYLYIRTDSGRFKDTKEIDSGNLAQYLNEENCNAYADSASVEEYEKFFSDALMEANHIIHISLAANTGKSYSMAVAAAKCFDHVDVIDSGHISGGEGLVALLAGKLVREGCEVNKIVEYVENVKSNVVARYLMPNANIFSRHGYAGRTAAKVFDTFNLHPVLGMRQSKLTIIGAEAGNLEKAWRHFIRMHIRNRRKIDPMVVIITHVGCTVREQEILKKEVLSRVHFQYVYIEKASMSNACNSGLKTVGIAYVYKH